MWFMVWRWPQSQDGDWMRHHLCKFAWHGPWLVWKWFGRDHVRWGRSKPGCQMVGSVTAVSLTAAADDLSSLHSGKKARCTKEEGSRFMLLTRRGSLLFWVGVMLSVTCRVCRRAKCVVWTVSCRVCHRAECVVWTVSCRVCRRAKWVVPSVSYWVCWVVEVCVCVFRSCAQDNWQWTLVAAAVEWDCLQQPTALNVSCVSSLFAHRK